MSSKSETSSVFTDDSGSRLRVVTLAIRGFLIVLGVGAASVAVSVFGHVTLPGLDSPLHIPGASRTHPPGNDADPVNERSTDAPVGTGTVVRSKPDSSGSRAAAVKTAAPTFAPSATQKPTASAASTHANHATGKPTAKPTPPHEPGVRPTEPPGRSKKTDTAQ